MGILENDAGVNRVQKNEGMTRRSVLKSIAVASGTLCIGFNTQGVLAAAMGQGQTESLNPFVKISADGVVTVVIKHFEMGQGTTTGLATLLAEELDANWQTLQTEFAPSDSDRYKNLYMGTQGTGGSTAIANSYMQYRQAGAAARDLLVRAAASQWDIAEKDITVEKGVVRAGNRTMGFGDLIETASKLQPESEPVLKSPEQFSLIGSESLHRVDNHGKTHGSATFTMDIKVPNMVVAVVLTSPRFGGSLKSFDASAAKKMAGFIDAKALPDKSGVLVYGRSTWAAISARKLVEAKWNFAAAENRSSSALVEYHQSLLDKPQFQAKEHSSRSVATEAIDNAARVIEQDFSFPHLAHAPMEPLCCVIEPVANGVVLHDGCQFPGMSHPTVAAVLGLKKEQVEINTVYAGGSFGRRATATADYQVQAAHAFSLLGGKTAVKLVWTREDDLKGGYYRPQAAHRARMGFDQSGNLLAWEHRIAAKPILKGSAMGSKDDIDRATVEGVRNSHYDIPKFSVSVSDAETEIPVLWWRSVGHSHTAYVMEVLVDMAAEAASADSVDFRRKLLAAGDAEHKDYQNRKRLLGVLNLAVEKSDWGKDLPENHGLGVAVHKSFGTYVAQVAEVSRQADGKIKIERVTCAVDCGVAVNPDIVRAQMEGGIGFGLGAVMRNEITFDQGEVVQSNFPDYEPLRMKDMPAVDVHIVPSAEPPSGVGEPGVPLIGPAVANAIYAVSGKRVTHLPMSGSGIEFV